MANKEDLFRFISIRGANTEKTLEAKKKSIKSYQDSGQETEFHLKLVEAKQLSLDEIKSITELFQKSEQYAKHYEDLDAPVHHLENWFVENPDEDVSEESLKNVSREFFGSSLGTFLSSDNYKNSRKKLGDSFISNIILGKTPTSAQIYLERLLKFIGFLEKLVEGLSVAAKAKDFEDFVAKSSILLPPNVFPLEEPIERFKAARTTLENNLRKAQPGIQPEIDFDKYRLELFELETAYNELSQINIAKSVSLPSNKNQQTKPSTQGLHSEPAAVTNPLSEISNNSLILLPNVYEQFRDETKKSVKKIGLEPENINPYRAIELIEKEITRISKLVYGKPKRNKLIKLGGVLIDSEKITNSITQAHLAENLLLRETTGSNKLDESCLFVSGVGDLLVVRQELKAYELGEFAHVENVLSGETRERIHRRLQQTEETFIEETEIEEESERDLQTAERFELQNEANKTVKEDLKLDAGLQVSGSYGPSVSFSAHANASFSRATEESQRRSSNFSREVTERSVEKIKEKVREERQRRVLDEIEETNRHEVNNSDTSNGHIRGIYRWLNKVSDAQVFNYGQRLMFEFLIPEPAAFFLYATVDNPPDVSVIPKPEEPKYFGGPLEPQDISRTNYHSWVSQYQIANVPHPPKQYLKISYKDSNNSEDVTGFSGSNIIKIDADYVATAATVQVLYRSTDTDAWRLKLIVGGEFFDFTNVQGAEYRVIGHRIAEASIVHHVLNVTGFSIGVDLHCELTDAAFQKWQHEVYDAIIQEYQNQLTDYEAQIAAADIQEGIEILGRNPLENRRIERDELKRLAISMMNQKHLTTFNSFLPFSEPYLDFDRALEEGSFARFFENAFEWHNIMYVFYPYFWGRKAKWINAIHFTDPDPDFAAFLKAGAARVQVPVRPGFEKALAYFCQTGEIWNGGDIPLIDDELYVPIIQEIKENLGNIEDGTPYPEDSEPWEVTVPTSMVLLQDLEEIPGIRDTLTGNDVTI